MKKSLRSRLCAGAGALAIAAVPVGIGITTGGSTSGRGSASRGSASTGFYAQALKVVKAELAQAAAPNLPAPLGLARLASSANTTQVASYNWSGYADVTSTKGKFTAVSAKWKVPSLSCSSEDRIESSWVGLDGINNGTVEQLGTVSQCFQGKAIHYSWYEMYPSGQVVVGQGVKGGDQISASVTRSGTSFTLKLTDSTRSGNNIKVTKSCSSCASDSAEWIIERPKLNTTGIVPLVKFSNGGFTSASQTSGGKKGTIATVSPHQYSMIDSTHTYYLAVPSSLSNGNAFTDTWKNSY